MNIKKAVIPVAGFGTRFLPITKSIPKEMLPVIDKPVIQYVVEEAIDAGIDDITFVISPEKQTIKDYFEKYPKLEARLKKDKKNDALELIKSIAPGVKFSYTIQEEPLGTGHALLCAKNLVKDDVFAYFDGDAIIKSGVPAILQVINVFNKYGASGAIAGTKVPRKNVIRYGNLDVEKISDGEYKLRRILEKPSIEKAPPYNLVIIGQRYVLNRKIFKYLENQKPGVNGEIWLADAADRMAREGNFYACEQEGRCYDTGNKLEFLKTIVEFALERNDIGKDFRKYLKELKI